MISTLHLVLAANILVLWMFINTFIADSLGIALVVITLIIGAVQYIRIPRMHRGRISEDIMSLFRMNKDDPKKNVIFHKAGASHAPENTLEAVQEAINLGIPAIEIDLEFTKDGVGVLIHGPLVDETTDGTGCVSQYTFDQLQTLNASAKDANKSKYPDVRIPTLEACVQICIQSSLVVFIDCKNDAKQTAKLMASLYQKYPELYGLGVVCSFYPNIIYAVRQADQNIITGLTHRNQILSCLGDGSPRNKEFWKQAVAPILDDLLAWSLRSFLWYICGNSFFLCCKDKLSLDEIKYWESLGVKVAVWTVNNPIEQEYCLKCLHVPVITDGLTEATNK